MYKVLRWSSVSVFREDLEDSINRMYFDGYKLVNLTDINEQRELVAVFFKED